jgi:chromosome segregation ATPase
VATREPDLPTYEETIISLADKLGGLSAVHEGLGVAARSLVDAHQELGSAKRDVEALTASNQTMLEEVRRLDPAQLAATLDTSLTRLSRETSEALDALSERLLSVAGEVGATRDHINTRFATIEERLAAQETAFGDRLAALDNSFDASLASVERTVVDVLTRSQEATQRGMDLLRQRHDALVPLLGQLQQQQSDLMQQIAVVSEAVLGVRSVADTTQKTVGGIREVTSKIEPSLSAAHKEMRNDLVSEFSQARRLQFASLAVLLIALALVWAV